MDAVNPSGYAARILRKDLVKAMATDNRPLTSDRWVIMINRSSMLKALDYLLFLNTETSFYQIEIRVYATSTQNIRRSNC